MAPLPKACIIGAGCSGFTTAKKLKDLETEFTNFRAHAGHERDKAAAALTEVQQRIALQASLITDLEAERDGVIAQLGAANQRIASLEGTVSAAPQAITNGTTTATLNSSILSLRT